MNYWKISSRISSKIVNPREKSRGGQHIYIFPTIFDPGFGVVTLTPLETGTTNQVMGASPHWVLGVINHYNHPLTATFILLTTTMKFQITALVLFSGALFFLSNCGDDNAVTTAELAGRWDIQNATRNGEPTTTMEGMYFVFSEDGKLLTNMTGAEETYSYELDGETILQRDGTIEADFLIESLAEGELILTTELRNKQFRMVLRQPAE